MTPTCLSPWQLWAPPFSDSRYRKRGIGAARNRGDLLCFTLTMCQPGMWKPKINLDCRRTALRADRVPAGFTGADSVAFFQGQDEDFAVADFAGLGDGGDRFYRGPDEVVVHGDFQLHFREQT